MKDLFKMLSIIPAYLRVFAGNTNVTTDGDLSEEMKKYYSDYLIDMADPELVHDQFGQKQPIPKNGGKTIQFRKYAPLAKALTPLTEGVTPDGQKLAVSVIEATVAQYGGYIELSDVLLLTAIDNNLVQATKLLGSQAGRTLDTITREVLNGGTNVQYANSSVSSRHALQYTSGGTMNVLTVDCIRRAVRALKLQNTPRIDGGYVGIIHPDAAYDLTSDPEWRYPHQYVDTDEIYNGEIGRIAGVRFVETTEAKIFHAEDLASDARNLAINGAVSANATTAVLDGGTFAADALKGRKLLINGNLYTVKTNTASSGTATITLETGEKFAAIDDDTDVYPGEAAKDGRDVYSTLILGENAYGVTEVTGGGLVHIVKQLGSAGTSDPLNQRATVGWKAIKVAERLVEQYMLRIETVSTFAAGAN